MPARSRGGENRHAPAVSVALRAAETALWAAPAVRTGEGMSFFV